MQQLKLYIFVQLLLIPFNIQVITTCNPWELGLIFCQNASTNAKSSKMRWCFISLIYIRFQIVTHLTHDGIQILSYSFLDEIAANIVSSQPHFLEKLSNN